MLIRIRVASKSISKKGISLVDFLRLGSPPTGCSELTDRTSRRVNWLLVSRGSHRVQRHTRLFRSQNISTLRFTLTIERSLTSVEFRLGLHEPLLCAHCHPRYHQDGSPRNNANSCRHTSHILLSKYGMGNGATIRLLLSLEGMFRDNQWGKRYPTSSSQEILPQSTYQAGVV